MNYYFRHIIILLITNISYFSYSQCSNLLVNAGTNANLNTETLYEETFAGQNGKGAIGNSIDLVGCTWTIDVSSANLSNTNDYFKVNSGKLEARDVDGICYWYSPVINIQNYINVDLSLVASQISNSNRYEVDDIFYSQYSLDGINYQSLSSSFDAKVWTYKVEPNLLSSGNYTFTVSGTCIAKGLPYNPSIGVLDGDETAVDSITFEIFKLPTITASNVVKKIGDPDFLLSPSSNSTGSFSYSALTPGIVSISGDSVSILAVGSTVVSITQQSAGQYSSKTVSFTITVNDTQSSNTTYTLSYPGGPQTKNSSTGQVTFTLSLAAAGDITVVSTPAGGCGSTVTKTVNIPKLASAGTISTTQGTLCYEGTASANIFSTGEATLAGGSSTASITYKWYYSNDGQASWVNITGLNTSTLATLTLQGLGGLVTNTIVKREAYASIGSVNCDPEVVAITINVNPALVVPSITSPATTCSSEDIRFTVGNAAGDTYRWTINGTVTATGNNFDIAANSLAAGSYILGVYGESGSCSSTLVTQTLTITDPSTLTIDTGLTGDAVCEGDSFTITVSDTQSSNTTYTLRYGVTTLTKNSSTGQVTFSLSLAQETDLNVTSAPIGGCPSTVTKTINIPKIDSAGTISTTASLFVCYGDSLSDAIYGDGTLATTTATLDSNSSSASITYQWQYSLASAPTSWVSITGAISSTLATTTLSSISITENITFKRVAIASIGGVECENSINNPTVDVTVENVDGGTISPNILYSCDISGSTYTVSVTDASSGNIRYQWQSSITNTASASFSNI